MGMPGQPPVAQIATPGAGMGAPPGGAPGAGFPTPYPPGFVGPTPEMVQPPPGTAPFPTREMAQPGFPMPQTKTEPRAPLQFAWGGGAPEDYQPGITDVLEMAGAPPGGREGFMGAEPPDPMQPGGYGPSQQDWRNVANPAGFESFATAPGVEETIRSIENPIWRMQAEEKARADAELGLQTGVLQEQARLAQEARQQMQQELDQAFEDALVQKNMEMQQAEGRDLNEEEQQFLYSQVYARVSGVDPLTGK